MKRSIFVMVMYFGLSLLACQDTKEDIKPTNESLKDVGEQIPFETGMQWIDFYKEKNHDEQGRLGLSLYSVSEVQVQAILQSVTDVVGVSFHYGIDDLGSKHIIVIPVDQSLKLWTNIPGRIYVDANSGEQITQEIASAWAARYRDQHPNSVWFHFFGEQIFDEIQAIPYFNSIEIQPAINILNLTPQMLLVIWNESLLIGNGRINGTAGTVYDASNACPPCAVE